MKTRNYISIITLCAFAFIIGRMEQTDQETGEAIYCQSVVEWRAAEKANIPWEYRKGHPDYKQIYNKVCEGVK